MSAQPREDMDIGGDAPLDDIEALRRELLRSRRDNAQFQLKVKNLSHALEGVQGQRHDADISAIRSFIVENRTSGPLVYEGVRVSVSSEPPVVKDATGKLGPRTGRNSIDAADLGSGASPAPRAGRSSLPESNTGPLPAQQQQQPTPHFVVNSFAALDVSARLASAQAGRRPTVRGSARAASIASASGASPLLTGEAPPPPPWLAAEEATGGGLPTPPNSIPPGVPKPGSVGIGPDHPQQRPASSIAKDAGMARPGTSGGGNPPPPAGAGRGSSAELLASGSLPGGGPAPDSEAPSIDGSLDLEDEEEEEEEEAPPPPPLGSPSASSVEAPEAGAAGQAPFGVSYFEPAEGIRPTVHVQPPDLQQQHRRRHSLPAPSPSAASEMSLSDTSRLQGLVLDLQGEIEEMRANFASTVEQARLEGGEAAASEVGGFYEDVVARHAAALEAEATRRLREEERANAVSDELVAVRMELAQLRARLSSDAGLDASAGSGHEAARQTPLRAAHTAAPAGGHGSGSRRASGVIDNAEIEYLRLHYENELAAAAKKAAESQEYAVAAVRSVLQGQLDDLNAIFEVQLAEGRKEAAEEATRAARAEYVDVEQRVAAAVAEAVSAAQQDADRQRVEAVRAALALAAGDFKSQLTTALSTLRENLLAEKAALRDSMEAEKQRDIEAHVTAARAEYEAVMNKYEQSTEAWRRDTVAACERSLDAARLQVAEARAQAQAQTLEADRLRAELERVTAQLQQSKQQQQQDAVVPPPQSSAPPGRFRASSSSGPTDAQTHVSTTPPAQVPLANRAPVASPRNVAAAKAYAAALAAEGVPVSADVLLAGGAAVPAATRPPSTSEPKSASDPAQVQAPAPAAAAPSLERGTEERLGSDSATASGGDDPSTGGAGSDAVPVCPAGVSQRLYTTILHMPVPALKGMLARAGIPHSDCREKNDLRERLLQAVEKGQSLSPTHVRGGTTAANGAAAPKDTHGDSREAHAAGDTLLGSASSATAPPAGPSRMPSRPSAGGAADDAAGLAAEEPPDGRGESAARSQQMQTQSQRETAPPSRSTAHPAPAGETGASDPAVRRERAPSDATTKSTSTGVAVSYASPQKPHLAASAAGLPESTTKAPSPQELKNWLPARASDGAVYYYHRITRAVRWDKPEAEIAKKMEARILVEDAAVKARQAERLAGLAADQEQARQAAAQRARIESEVDGRVKAWSRGKGIRQLLVTLHTVLTTRTVPEYVVSGASASGSAEELKKTYHKAIRLVHPDKVAPTASLEAQIESQKIFAVLSEAYKKYSDAEAAGGGAGAGLASFTTAAQNARRTPSAGEMPSFGSFGAGSSGVSGAAARARAAFNAMHSATRGPTTAGGIPTGGGPGVGAGGARFTTFSAHSGYSGGVGWAGPGMPSGSTSSR